MIFPLFPTCLSHSMPPTQYLPMDTIGLQPAPLLAAPTLSNSSESSITTNGVSASTVEVDTPHNCPNVRCNIKVPHTYIYTISQPLAAKSADVLSLSLSRHQVVEGAIPPHFNCWVVVDKPSQLLGHGQHVYLRIYGEVILKDKKDPIAWRLWQRIRGDRVVYFECEGVSSGTLETHLAVQVNWTKRNTLAVVFDYLCSM